VILFTEILNEDLEGILSRREEGWEMKREMEEGGRVECP